MDNVESIDQLIGLIMVVGFLLGVGFALAVNAGYQAMQWFVQWRKYRKMEKGYEEGQAEAAEESFARYWEGLPTEEPGAVDGTRTDCGCRGVGGMAERGGSGRVDVREQLPSVVIELARQTGVGTREVLRRHRQSMLADPSKHEGCEICPWEVRRRNG